MEFSPNLMYESSNERSTKKRVCLLHSIQKSHACWSSYLVSQLWINTYIALCAGIAPDEKLKLIELAPKC